MAGVTYDGFEAKRLADVLSDAEAELSTIVDPASGESLQPDFGSEDPAMQVVQVPLDAVGTAWEALQLVWEQFDPSKAVGPSLSGLVQLNGITRQDAAPSTVTLSLAGTPGTLVPAGSVASDANNVNQWATVEDKQIGIGGTASVDAKCTVFGPVSADANTINNIVTTVPGWLSVNNPIAAQPGRDIETDDELRQRRRRSTLAPAAGPVESIYANLADLPGVSYARVRQNNTLSVDSNGIPPKSVAAVVVGGEDEDIAYTLLARTGVTSEWFGSSSLTLFDQQNEPYVVKWTRPTPLPIYIDLTIDVYNTSVFPADGLQQIKDAIIAYAAGGAPAIGIEDGFNDTGFPPGETVRYSRLFTPINSVPGHRVTSLTIGTSPSPAGESDIPTPWDEFPEFTAANIDITVL